MEDKETQDARILRKIAEIEQGNRRYAIMPGNHVFLMDKFIKEENL